MSAAGILFASFGVLMLMGAPITVALGAAAMAALYSLDQNLVTLVQIAFTSVNSYQLMALPVFVLAGALMEHAGLSRRLIALTESVVGPIPGGLAVSTALACVFFGAISGSGPATSEGTDAVHTASRPGGEPEAGTEDDNAAESAPGDSETEQEESEYANLAIAQVSHYVNVRQEPNTESEILGKIYNGAVAQIQAVAGEEQDWFQVISGNVEGYIKSEYFLYGDEAVEAVDEYVTRYAAVTVDRLNVRQEPSTDSRRIGYAGQGEKLKLLEQQGDWMLVQYTEDQTGYVAAEYVTVSEEFLYAKSIEEERAEQEAQRELARRMAEQEQAVPENTVAAPLTPPAAVYTSNEELRRAIVDYAMLYLGYPYVHGGRSLAGGTDCSGFTCYIYADFGYSISRTPSGQYSSAGRSIDYSEIQPGDIICYGKSKCTHVGMYIGDGQIIHAANSRKGVVIYDAGYDTILDVRNVID